MRVFTGVFFFAVAFSAVAQEKSERRELIGKVGSRSALLVLHATERPDGGTHLKLASHGRELEFARLLNDDERRDFAHALKDALAAARFRAPI